MKIDNTSVLTSAIYEIVVALQNDFDAIKNGMWLNLFDKSRYDYKDDEPIRIEVDGEDKILSANEIDELILSKCEDLTVDIEKAISSKNGMVLILNNNGER